MFSIMIFCYSMVFSGHFLNCWQSGKNFIPAKISYIIRKAFPVLDFPQKKVRFNLLAHSDITLSNTLGLTPKLVLLPNSNCLIRVYNKEKRYKTMQGF